MTKERLPPLKIGNYELEFPIIQGGMSVRISGAELVTAVTKCGGAGTIGGVGRGFENPEFEEFTIFEANRLALRKELQIAKEVDPYGVWGVNILVAVRDFDELVRESVESGTKFIVAGAGLPLKLPELTADHPEVALIPIVSSVQGVRIMCERWSRGYNRLPDAIVIEAPSVAGGHLGVTPKQGIYDEDLKLENAIPASRKYLEAHPDWHIPLIAAGGIWNRDDIDRMLKLGADGVQMATRFVCTPECEAPPQFKQKYINSTPENIVIIQSPVGIPGRAIKTRFLDEVERGKIQDHCRINCLINCGFKIDKANYCIVRALANARAGDVENGIVFSGSNAYRSKEQGIVSVRQIFEELTGD